MEFLRFLESIRTGVGNFFFATVTHLGEEVFFLAIAILFYWCISKRQGYYILLTAIETASFSAAYRRVEGSPG